MLFSKEAFGKVLDIDLETAVGWKEEHLQS